uniref:Uncharacterized protein n=1 Tax=Arundo donax TaxID=35708 RepID=A0A0A8ZFU7_ARUDO
MELAILVKEVSPGSDTTCRSIVSETH